MENTNLLNLTLNDIKVMSLMFDTTTGIGLSKAKGMTIEEIALKASNIMSESKIRNAITKLIQCGYADLGIKQGKKKSYHITSEGFEYILKIKENVIDIKKD